MPRNLSSIAIVEKNKMASTSSWLLAAEITIPGLAEPVRIIQGDQSVTWRGVAWVAFPFIIDPIGEESKGEVPQATMRVSNISRVMEAYLQDYDTYTKANGFSPITVTIYLINTLFEVSQGVITDSTEWGAATDTEEEGAYTDALYNIANPEPEAQFDFEMLSPRTDCWWATFTLGAASLFNKRFPPHRILRNHCRFAFKSVLCGYTGATTTCDKTLGTCRSLSNSARFGGFPGVGLGELRVSN